MNGGRKKSSRRTAPKRGKGAQTAKSRAKAIPARTSSVREAKSAIGLVRLNKFLADNGVASRRASDELIADGKVSVDGEPVTQVGTKIDPALQSVEVDGVVFGARGSKGAGGRYYLLNKPAGVVCTNEKRENRPRAIDLITARDKGRIYTVGRLDEESKGLIILTTDGEFAQRIAHPRYGVPKTYVVRVMGRIDDEALNKVRTGVHLSEGRTGGARILVKRRTQQSSTLTVTIREGMNREIRRAFARVGHKVVDLKRTRIGTLSDRGLKIGRWRPLSRAEVEELLALDPEGTEKEETRERLASRHASEKRSKRRPLETRGPKHRTRGAADNRRTTRKGKRSGR